mmetsp:Transcript_18618/g.34488  ORF Transcript_18618/g.34488 Transcript_18618/m.34488 type:complete len:151 (+) Transcript_18618:109-561(+)
MRFNVNAGDNSSSNDKRTIIATRRKAMMIPSTSRKMGKRRKIAGNGITDRITLLDIFLARYCFIFHVRDGVFFCFFSSWSISLTLAGLTGLDDLPSAGMKGLFMGALRPASILLNPGNFKVYLRLTGCYSIGMSFRGSLERESCCYNSGT